jgi:hypothetical protein
MTWANLLSKTLGLALLLPAVLTKFTGTDIILWYVLTTMVGIGLLFDLGFTPTFVRFVAYAKTGASVDEMARIGKGINPKAECISANSDGLISVFKIINKNYLLLSVLAFTLLLCLGSLFVAKPISESTNALNGWLSWFIVIGTTSFLLFGNKYVAILQGMGLIAENQKAMMITSVTATIVASIALLLNGNILLVILLYQGITALSFFLNRSLVKKHVPSYFETSIHKTFTQKPELAEIKLKEAVFASAWKCAVGILMSVGLIHLSALGAANYLSTSDAAAYLLALQLIRAISTFSQAPFYTKIPTLSGLYATQQNKRLGEIAFNAELQSLAFFTFACLSCGILFPYVESLFNFNASLPDKTLWVLLSLGILIERAGAMHIQIYSLTNNIIWHYVNGLTGVCMIMIFLLLIAKQGVTSFPLSILISYGLFYFPISSFYAVRVVGKKYIIKQLCWLVFFLLILSFWRLSY